MHLHQQKSWQWFVKATLISWEKSTITEAFSGMTFNFATDDLKNFHFSSRFGRVHCQKKVIIIFQIFTVSANVQMSFISYHLNIRMKCSMICHKKDQGFLSLWKSTSILSQSLLGLSMSVRIWRKDFLTLTNLLQSQLDHPWLMKKHCLLHLWCCQSRFPARAFFMGISMFKCICLSPM